MISVSLDNAVGFFVEHLLHGRAGADLVPHPTFRLKEKSQLVRGFERSFGRAPGMKLHQIQSPFLVGLEKFAPGFYVCWRISRERKISAVVRSTQIYFAAVQNEILAVG